MKTVLAIAAALGLAAGLATAVDEPKPPTDLDAFMELKLEHAKEVLSGLALEDFDLIVRHGQKLSLLSQEATWQVLQTEEYLQQSLEFRRAADAMTEAARKKNLDGAALAYVELTMKCVNCHKYVRDTRMAQAAPAAASELAAAH